jgi:acyl-coenzyme A synthetase/AMP-(fatty) acid ligase
VLSDAATRVGAGDLVAGTSLAGGPDALRGRSVLIATRDQLTAMLAFIELDGIARRIVLGTPDLTPDQADRIAAAAGVDVVVSDHTGRRDDAGHTGPSVVACSLEIMPYRLGRGASHRTEWVLLTSGTTGVPKMVSHTLTSLVGAINDGAGGEAGTGAAAVWSTFYDIRRYGGLQVALRALIAGAPLVLSDAREAIRDFLARAGTCGVTHITGTPSHWRRALMSSAEHSIAPQYVRLSGEAPDQAILDQLRAAYPRARIVHAFASTEAGVAFEVADGLAGFPEHLVRTGGAGVEMKVEEGSLRIRSPRTASDYLGSAAADGQGIAVADADGFVDTGDLVELRADGRYHFVGRRGGIVNVGGLKVHPEEVEAVINLHPGVQVSLVTARSSPITGAVVAADVVARAGSVAAGDALKAEILDACRRTLSPHKVPAVIRLVPSLEIAASGKLARPRA